MTIETWIDVLSIAGVALLLAAVHGLWTYTTPRTPRPPRVAPRAGQASEEGSP